MTSTQFKLMAALAGLILLVVLTSGLLAERGLRKRETARIERSLTERAYLVAELTRDIRFDVSNRRRLDQIADRAAFGAAARITLIGADGAVVGDSNIPLDRLAGIEDHSKRPEVVVARRGGIGSSQRRSDTVGRRLFYLAIPSSGGAGVVRLAVDLSDVEAAVSDLRRELFAAGAVGLLGALVLSYVLTSITFRPIHEIRRVVASIAGGQLDNRMSLGWGDELGDISTAINQLAEQLRDRLNASESEEERLKAVLNGMVEGVLVLDLSGGIVLANEPIREFYDVWIDVEALTPLEAFRNRELDRILAEAAISDEAVSREVEVGRARPRTLQVHAVRFPAAPAERLGTVAVFHDVSEIERLEQIRRDFVANASHELRTPLAAIQGFTETLLEGNEPSESERRTYLEIIDRHARRLGALVADLLELSRIEGGATGLELTSVDIGAVTESLIEDSAPRYREKRLTVTNTLSGDTRALANRQAVEQVVSNLVDNAVKYTPAGGEIDVSVSREEAGVVLRVSDTGIGIPAEDLDRIFERFYRVDKARSRALGGTGLGLSIVKHLVQSMGGEIRVESKLDVGTTFTVRFAAA